MHRFTTLAFAAFMATTLAASPFTGINAQSKDSRKQRMVSKLMQKAKPTENSKLSRALDAVEIDFSGYEIKFDKCQYVKAYDDELAENEESSSVLATKRFIVFRLCPAGTCSTCAYNFGEYLVDMETYLESTTAFFQEDRENACGLCNDVCYADDDVTKNAGAAYVDCSSCMDYCAFVDAMDDNGYVESSEYAQCVQVYADDNGAAIYAGAMCSDSGSSLKIAAFSDEYCSEHKSGTNVENYLEGVQLNDDIMSKVVDSENCVSCLATSYEIPEGDDAAAADDAAAEVNEICQTLYEGSAKCESKYGFDNYWKNYEEYANQYVQEDLVCDFITSLGSGSYDQYGEIVLNGSSSGGGVSGASGGQKFAMTMFVLGTIGIGVYAAQLHTQLTKGGKTDLSAQGGAMA